MAKQYNGGIVEWWCASRTPSTEGNNFLLGLEDPSTMVNTFFFGFEALYF